jgi:hypothetical protein
MERSHGRWWLRSCWLRRAMSKIWILILGALWALAGPASHVLAGSIGCGSSAFGSPDTPVSDTSLDIDVPWAISPNQELPGRCALAGYDSASGSLLAARGVRHVIPEGRAGHIFRDARGHLPDTPAKRRLLQGVADDASTTLGVDKWGNTWSARTLGDGAQAWVQTRGGVIVNGGLNQVPRTFPPGTGLSAPGGQ